MYDKCCSFSSESICTAAKSQRLAGMGVRKETVWCQCMLLIYCYYWCCSTTFHRSETHTKIFILQIFVECLCSRWCAVHAIRIGVCTNIISSMKKSANTCNYSIAIEAVENGRCKIECACGNVHLFVFQNCFKVKWLNQKLAAMEVVPLNVFGCLDGSLIIVL